jgi:uncharacterized membrane protein YdbT with pleckstrin-like domain
MQDRIIRPSMKTVWASYAIAVIVILAGMWVYFEYLQNQNWPPWVAAILLILLVPPMKMHLTRRLIKMRMHDDHLTLETGFFSRTRRTVDMAKVQDVTVRQTFGQRLLGVGDLRLESAGESGGAIAIGNLDRPRELADEIIAGSKRSPGSGMRAGLG